MSQNKTIQFSVQSPEQKEYLNRIAREKGFKGISDMSRYALAKLFTSMKVSFLPDKTDHGP